MLSDANHHAESLKHELAALQLQLTRMQDELLDERAENRDREACFQKCARELTATYETLQHEVLSLEAANGLGASTHLETSSNSFVHEAYHGLHRSLTALNEALHDDMLESSLLTNRSPSQSFMTANEGPSMLRMSSLLGMS